MSGQSPAPRLEGTALAAADVAPAAREVIDLSVLEGEITLEQYRPDCLPPDISYCMDCEQEWGGIGADDRAYVDLFDAGTAEWFDALQIGGADRFASVLKARHAAWRETADPALVMGVDWAGLKGLRWLFEDCALGVAGELVHASTPETVIGAPARALAGLPAQLPSSRDAERFAACAGPILERARGSIARWGREAFLASRNTVQDLYDQRRRAVEERNQSVRDRLAGRLDMALMPSRPVAPGPQAKPAPGRRERLRMRRVLAKSYQFLENVAGRQRAKAWLSGDEVAVEGRRFDFRLRVADVTRATHGAVDVFVTDKHGVELAKLCVYAPDTPALDQVSSMVLHVVAGAEDEIIRAANVIRSTEAAMAHAPFLEVRGNRREVMDLGIGSRATSLLLPHVRDLFAGWVGATLARPLEEALGERLAFLRAEMPAPALGRFNGDPDAAGEIPDVEQALGHLSL